MFKIKLSQKAQSTYENLQRRIIYQIDQEIVTVFVLAIDRKSKTTYK